MLLHIFIAFRCHSYSAKIQAQLLTERKRCQPRPQQLNGRYVEIIVRDIAVLKPLTRNSTKHILRKKISTAQ